MKNQKSSKEINLIPLDMAVPARAVKISKLLNKVSVIAVIILMIVSLVLGGLIFYFNDQGKKIADRTADLRRKITNSQQNEQKLVLAKDRLKKITTVQKLKSVNNEIERFKKFSSIVTSSSESTVSEATLNSTGTEVSLLSQTSFGLSQVLKPLSDLVDYKQIILTSLGYNPGVGFISTINLKNE